jgi:hypothetical protein
MASANNSFRDEFEAIPEMPAAPIPVANQVKGLPPVRDAAINGELCDFTNFPDATSLERELLTNRALIAALADPNTNAAKKTAILDYLNDTERSDIKGRLVAFADKSQTAATVNTSKARAENSTLVDYVQTPTHGENRLISATRKEFAISVGQFTFAGTDHDSSSKKTTHTLPLRQVLKIAKDTIEDKTLSENASYDLLRTVLRENALSLMTIQEELETPFSQFWTLLQSTYLRFQDPSSAMAELQTVKSTTPSEGMGPIIQKIIQLNKSILANVPKVHRHSMVIQQSRQDILHMIRTYFNYLYQDVMEQDAAERRASEAEKATLDAREASGGARGTQRLQYNELTSLAQTAIHMTHGAAPTQRFLIGRQNKAEINAAAAAFGAGMYFEDPNNQDIDDDRHSVASYRSNRSDQRAPVAAYNAGPPRRATSTRGATAGRDRPTCPKCGLKGHLAEKTRDYEGCRRYTTPMSIRPCESCLCHHSGPCLKDVKIGKGTGERPEPRENAGQGGMA